MAVSDKLKSAVADKDMVAVKSSFYTIILSDPGFETQKFEEALKYVKEHGLEGIIDEHDGEEWEPAREWNEVYFDMQASKLQDNFSVERMTHLKEVGRSLQCQKKAQESAAAKNLTIIADSKQNEYVRIAVAGAMMLLGFLFIRLFRGDKS